MRRLFTILFPLLVCAPAFSVGDLEAGPESGEPEKIDSERVVEEPEPLPELPKVKRIDRRKPAASSTPIDDEPEPDDPSRRELAPETATEKAQRIEEDQDLDEQEKARQRRKKYRSSLDFAIDITYSYFRLESYDYATNVINENKGHFVQGSFEWLPIVRYGKFGVGAHFGVYLIPDKEFPNSLGTAGLNGFPIGAFVTYRFDYFEHQVLVPYGRLGSSFWFVSQASKNGSLPRDGTQNVTTLDASFGLALNLFWLDQPGANQMDQDYSVNETYFFVEYASVSSPAGRQPNVDHKAWRGGLRLEF